MRAPFRHVLLASCVAVATTAHAQAGGALADLERAAIARVVGDPDPGGAARAGRIVRPSRLVTAMYQGTRTERLVAIDAAAAVDDPWEVLPYLASFMGARERQTASRAAASLAAILESVAASPEPPPDAVRGQAKQLAGQLAAVAREFRLDPDLRASALAGQRLLSLAFPGLDAIETDAIRDDDVEVRKAALAALDLPVPDDLLRDLGEMAEREPCALLRGQAAGLLCENALARGVGAPSPALRDILAALFRDGSIPTEAVAPALACLARFPQAARADLVDLALARKDPSLQAFWGELGEQPSSGPFPGMNR